eukprot:SAG31_NODE_5204_length_2678_cov_1.637069_3_plen_77_part_00
MGAVDRQALGGVWSKAVRGSGMGVDCEQQRADTVFLDADASDVESAKAKFAVHKAGTSSASTDDMVQFKTAVTNVH